MPGLTLLESHWVSMAWASSVSGPTIMARAWAAAGRARCWPEAYGAARMCGAVPEDASALADGLAASMSPNTEREAWIDAVERLVRQWPGDAGCGEWLMHADLHPDPAAGVRMAAGTARAHIAGCRDPFGAAQAFLSVLHSAVRPPPAQAAASCGLAGFEMLDRWYLAA